MGRIIDWYSVRNKQRVFSETTTSTRPPETRLSIALSDSLEARRQIGALLEAITEAERLADAIADDDSRQALLLKLWDSRRDLLVALKHISTTIEVLSKVASREQSSIDK